MIAACAHFLGSPTTWHKITAQPILSVMHPVSRTVILFGTAIIIFCFTNYFVRLTN